MKKVLLDTHSLIWSLTEPKKIPSKTRKLLENPETRVCFSTVSLWEISLKFSLGKLKLRNLAPEDFLQGALEQNFDKTTISENDALGFRNVPRHIHSEPFDRMLIWQAITRELIFISAESGLDEYAHLGLRWQWD